MDGSFWVGIAVIVALAAVTVLALVMVRARGRRLPPVEPGAEEARVEAEQLRELGRRDGYPG
jgi:hypothetical protein